MKSKWYDKKILAIKLRKEGLSIGIIESQLKIPRSTLSGWFKNIELTEKQKLKLEKGRKEGLIKARKNAVLWHNTQKERRLKEAKEKAVKIFKKINSSDLKIIELALAILYSGEGSKKNIETALGSSDPRILKFFLVALKNIYNLEDEKIRCELYLRADQNPDEMKYFWSKELKLPISNFRQVNIDKRTEGTKTYPHYNGVCNIRCGNVAIQRELMYLSELFFEKVITMGS